jgi:hypothetical protein
MYEKKAYPTLSTAALVKPFSRLNQVACMTTRTQPQRDDEGGTFFTESCPYVSKPLSSCRTVVVTQTGNTRSQFELNSIHRLDYFPIYDPVDNLLALAIPVSLAEECC